MHQEIEIEFKNLLTKEEFYLLCERFSLSEADFIMQENHYFDSEDFALKNKGSIGQLSLIVNGILYAICALLFNVETAIYSIILLNKSKSNASIHSKS